jgi:hypothetical protein
MLTHLKLPQILPHECITSGQIIQEMFPPRTKKALVFTDPPTQDI